MHWDEREKGERSDEISAIAIFKFHGPMIVRSHNAEFRYGRLTSFSYVSTLCQQFCNYVTVT